MGGGKVLNKASKAQKWAENYVIENEGIISSLISGNSGRCYQSELLIENYGSLNQGGYYDIDGIAALFLLKTADKQAPALKAIKIIISENIKAQQKIPEIWREIHSEIVLDTHAKPKTNAKLNTKDWRNFVAMIMVAELMEQFDLPFSFNPASCNGTSAIEIVLSAFKKVIPQTNYIQPTALEQGIRRLATQ
jgi:hypothetical protein